MFTALGHDFRFWMPEGISALDIFSEACPDVYLGSTYGLDRAVLKALARRPQTKVALYCSAWGPLADEVPADYPITRAEDEEKERVGRLVQSGQLKFVFSHVHGRYVEPLLGGWREIGATPIGILNAADTFSYLGGRRREDLACDVGFVGGWWPYKSKTLGPYMAPLCHENSGLRVKIFGNQPWPVGCYLGLLDEADARDLFASATVCPNVSEPHSQEFGYDLIERPFKVMAAGGFCLSDYVRGFRDLFTADELPMYSSPDEFHYAVHHYVKHPEQARRYAEAGRKAVLARHTYWHRVAQLLDGLGFSTEADRCLHLYQQTSNKTHPGIVGE